MRFLFSCRLAKFIVAGCALWVTVVAQAALPEGFSNALRQARIAESDVAVVIMDARPGGKVWLRHNESAVMSPASVIKLVTTYAALDILGPDYTWKTVAFVQGRVSGDTLHGTLYIRGSGDPSMTDARMRELLWQVQAAGIKHIDGNLLIDQSAYAIEEIDPAAFDGEPLRPYNVRPEALLFNFKTVAFTFNPSLANTGDMVPVVMTPTLVGVEHTQMVRVGQARNCGDWKGELGGDFSDPLNLRLTGNFPGVCGPKQWYLAFPDPRSYVLRAIAGLWQELGGTVSGTVGFGTVPSDARFVGAVDSKPMAEVVRDVNKFSNNVMAQSVFLALSLPDQKSMLSCSGIGAAASYERSAEVVNNWWRALLPSTPAPVMENGSGLSRIETISAQGLAQMLQKAWIGSTMPEFIASLPIASIDGTMRRSRATASAHIKTGSVRNVIARAGYVLAPNGERRIFVLLINSPNASAATPAIDLLIDWAAEQQ